MTTTRPSIPNNARRFHVAAYPNMPREVVYRYGYTWPEDDGATHFVQDIGQRLHGPTEDDYASLLQRYNESASA